MIGQGICVIGLELDVIGLGLDVIGLGVCVIGLEDVSLVVTGLSGNGVRSYIGP